MRIHRNLLSVIVGATVAVIFLAMGFMQEEGGAYLFPKILAIVFAILAGLDFLKSFRQEPETEKKLGSALYPWRIIAPGLGVLILYLASMETLGFYATSLLGFFLMATAYRKSGAMSVRTCLFDLVIATVFTGAMYVLFSVTLRVQTPQGWLL